MYSLIPMKRKAWIDVYTGTWGAYLFQVHTHSTTPSFSFAAGNLTSPGQMMGPKYRGVSGRWCSVEPRLQSHKRPCEFWGWDTFRNAMDETFGWSTGSLWIVTFRMDGKCAWSKCQASKLYLVGKGLAYSAGKGMSRNEWNQSSEGIAAAGSACPPVWIHRPWSILCHC